MKFDVRKRLLEKMAEVMDSERINAGDGAHLLFSLAIAGMKNGGAIEAVVRILFENLMVQAYPRSKKT